MKLDPAIDFGTATFDVIEMEGLLRNNSTGLTYQLNLFINQHLGYLGFLLNHLIMKKILC